MIKWLWACVAVGFLTTVQGPPASAADAKPCLLRAIAKLDMHFEGAHVPIISLPLAGQPHPFLIDTGSAFTALTNGAVEKLGLHMGSIVIPDLIRDQPFFCSRVRNRWQRRKREVPS